MKGTRIRITGIVQGVGMRPFIYNLAIKYKLKGFCLNASDGVMIEVSGEGIEKFIEEIKKTPPPLARIDSFVIEPVLDALFVGFEIKKSHDEKGRFTIISPDIAVCKACLRELNDSSDRRYKYAFINCTNCGPRFSITLALPYDRENTTMKKFKMCAACEEEYHDPSNRRFHAEPSACHECGPDVWLVDNNGKALDKGAPRTNLGTKSLDVVEKVSFKLVRGAPAIMRVKELLKEGAIVAIKGLGGFHIAADATSDAAVKRLRNRKRRSNKPFAIMASDIETIKTICNVREEEEKLLTSNISPIVILEKKSLRIISQDVAPSNSTLGAMLPYTPLHHILMEATPPLVMTSGNLSEEPIAITNEEALEKLSGIADFFLLHDRDIYMRVDDSIVRVINGKTLVLRRGRGYTPLPVNMGEDMGEVFAVGAELKNTFTITKDRYAILSQHIGDLENISALDFFKETFKNLKNTFRSEPDIIAYDMHPDYLSTRFALEYKEKNNIPDARAIPVQHHHAHIVSAMAEHGIRDRVIGVAFDGTGYGADGHIWGGEFLIADRKTFERKAHLKYTALPGGDAAIKEPWRIAAALLYNVFGEDFYKESEGFVSRIGRAKIGMIIAMIKKNINCPMTSSMGRLFDAVSSLIGLCDSATFEAEGAILLEKYAVETSIDIVYPFTIEDGIIDTSPLIKAIVSDIKKGTRQAVIAAIFHNTVVEMIIEAAVKLKKETGIEKVVLSGGVFQNSIILSKSVTRLEQKGFSVWHNEKIPINDGGISMGQAVVAAENIKE